MVTYSRLNNCGNMSGSPNSGETWDFRVNFLKGTAVTGTHTVLGTTQSVATYPDIIHNKVVTKNFHWTATINPVTTWTASEACLLWAGKDPYPTGGVRVSRNSAVDGITLTGSDTLTIDFEFQMCDYELPVGTPDGTPTYLETLDKLDQWSSAHYIPQGTRMPEIY